MKRSEGNIGCQSVRIVEVVQENELRAFSRAPKLKGYFMFTTSRVINQLINPVLFAAAAIACHTSSRPRPEVAENDISRLSGNIFSIVFVERDNSLFDNLSALVATTRKGF